MHGRGDIREGLTGVSGVEVERVVGCGEGGGGWGGGGGGGEGEGCVLVKSDGALLFIEQNVVRNWYARFPQITNNARNLIDNAEEAAKALIEGELCIKVSGASSTRKNFLFNPTFGM